MNRYQRQIVLEDVGLIGQKQLSQTRVLVVGAGGLGAPVLWYLAAAGIGKLGIVDFDTVESSNLNRQTLYTPGDIGQFKATCAKNVIQSFNPEIEVNAYDVMLDLGLALSLIPEYDIIMDCTDHIPTRYVIDDVAYAYGRTTVYGAIYKHEGQVAVFNHQGSPGYRCLFPDMPSEANAPNCAIAGVLGVLPGVIGSIQANEAIKVALGHQTTLKGMVLHYDARHHKTTTIRIPVHASRPDPKTLSDRLKSQLTTTV